MSETEKPKEEEEQTDSKFQKVFDDLEEESTNNWTQEFKDMVHSDEWILNGEKFHFQMQSHKRLGEMKKLQNIKIDEVKDWDGYVDNYRQRAKLLIKEMTDEKFDELDFYPLENLVTAWSIRGRRGFRSKQSGANNGLPDGTQTPSSI